MQETVYQLTLAYVFALAWYFGLTLVVVLRNLQPSAGSPIAIMILSIFLGFGTWGLTFLYLNL